MTIPLNDLTKGEEKTAWYTLQGVKTGEVQVGLTAHDFGKERSIPPQQVAASLLIVIFGQKVELGIFSNFVLFSPLL